MVGGGWMDGRAEETYVVERWIWVYILVAFLSSAEFDDGQFVCSLLTAEFSYLRPSS